MHPFHAFPCLIISPLPMQSLSESMIPDALLERLLSSTTEFPPVCAIIGGILGQVVMCFGTILNLESTYRA